MSLQTTGSFVLDTLGKLHGRICHGPTRLDLKCWIHFHVLGHTLTSSCSWDNPLTGTYSPLVISHWVRWSQRYGLHAQPEFLLWLWTQPDFLVETQPWVVCLVRLICSVQMWRKRWLWFVMLNLGLLGIMKVMKVSLFVRFVRWLVFLLVFIHILGKHQWHQWGYFSTSSWLHLTSGIQQTPPRFCPPGGIMLYFWGSACWNA